MQPCINRATLTIAPTVGQRLKYKDVLTVYGKQRKRCTLRQAQWIKKYNVSCHATTDFRELSLR